jgi:hypothetical protein
MYLVMHRLECNKQLFSYINNFLEFLSFVKIRVLQTYPLKMNLIAEIRMDRKRNLAFNLFSLSQVDFSSVWWLHCTLHILILLFHATLLDVSSILTRYS